MGKIYNWPISPLYHRMGLEGNNKSRPAKSTTEGRIQAK